MSINDQSAQPCGCDAGAHYLCEVHLKQSSERDRKVQLVKGLMDRAFDDLQARAAAAEVAFVVKDEGDKQTFASGSKRNVDESKVDYSRAFDGPMFERLAVHLTKANKMYPDAAPGVPNWTLISTEEERVRYRKSAFRHFIQWYRGDRDEDHASAVLFNINGVELIDQKRKEQK